MKRMITLLLLSVCLCIGCTAEGLDATPTTTENGSDDQKENEATDEKNDKQSKQLDLDGTLTVHYIDVGQGDATLFEVHDKEDMYTILYDTGDWQGNEVVPYLQQQGIETVDIIIISHPHADHIGQLEAVLTTFDVGEVWMTGNTANSEVYTKAAETIVENDIDYDEPQAGDVFDIGPLTLHVLHPETLTGGLNEDSLSIHFSYGDMAFLFTGDAYTAQEEQIMASGINVEAPFLHLGHHGSKTSSSEKFIDAVDPTYAIYSAGANNSYGHPNEEVLDRLAARDITVYGTDVHGNIVVTTNGSEADIVTDKDGTVTAGDNNEETSETATKDSSSTPKQTEEPAPTAHCIDINEASASDLQAIIHIGEQRAKDIIAARPFSTIDDLQRIDGIGPARIDDITLENKACVGGD